MSLREREVQELVALSLAGTLGIKRGGVLRAWGPALDIHGTLLPRGFVTQSSPTVKELLLFLHLTCLLTNQGTLEPVTINTQSVCCTSVVSV